MSALVARVRGRLRRSILRVQRRTSTPGRFSLSLAQTLNILYPQPIPEELRLDDLALEVNGSLLVKDLQAVRKILSALDGPSAPSPVHVRFGAADITTADLNGAAVVLDRADLSVSREVLAGRGYESEVTAVLESVLAEGMTFVDVGANIGIHTVLGSRLVGPSGRVFAVEPYSENCRMILMAMAENHLDNITLLPVALDDHRGWVHLATNIGSNASLVSGEADQIARGYGTIVPSFRLDELVEGPIDVVKVDVEGAEGRAMAGAGGLLEKWRPTVITEASEEMLQRVSNVSVKVYVEGFTRQGYTASLLDRNGGPPREIDDLEDFFAQWTDFLRVENLLLRPEERSGRTLES